MTRIIKEYSVRRSEILDAAQRLVYTKGYELMTIQDILDALQISKGAFYHYFESKQALLEALIERWLEEASRVLEPIVQDPGMSASEKLQRYFDTAIRWKTAQKAFLFPLLRVWYADENALVRQKMTMATFQQVAPHINAIMRQGVQEGTIQTAYADQAGEIVMGLLQNLGDTITVMLVNSDRKELDVESIVNTVLAYTDAIERVLGTQHGLFSLMTPEIIEEWVNLVRNMQPASGS